MSWLKKTRLGFYFLNAKWNFKFWMFSEKIYKNHSYTIESQEFDLGDVDIIGKIIPKKKNIVSRRFVGYMYDGMIHLDNPGLRHTIDKDTWNAWRSKKIVK